MPSKFLIVTEKHAPSAHQRDGGARVVQSLLKSLGENATILQFSDDAMDVGLERLRYPHQHADRFQRRLLNAEWVATQVSLAARDVTDVVFVHISMCFGSRKDNLAGKRVWLLPMLMGLSYRQSGEHVTEEYLQEERRCVMLADRIITPSHFEKRQLIEGYGAISERVKVIPRGIPAATSAPVKRPSDVSLKICSVGSIKPQKNTLGLVKRFSAISKQHPEARLGVIGPVQNEAYHRLVLREIDALGLREAVTFYGYVPPESLGATISEFDIHLTDSLCETFGRAIFETLSHGIPNLLPGHGYCAAAEHLSGTPYCRFFTDEETLLKGLDELLDDLPFRSEMATEAHHHFSQPRLDRLLVAEMIDSSEMLIADYDGTIFHKHDPQRTAAMVQAASKYSSVAVCSARSITALREALAGIGLKPDWLIGLSGAEIESFNAKSCWREGLTEAEVSKLSAHFPEGILIKNHGLPVQMLVGQTLPPLGFRAETYPEGMYLSSWKHSKLTAALKLIDRIGWSGRVTAWGDGPHDVPLLTYFDGILIGSSRPPTHSQPLS
jgi:glycosyltransferase involved in cell wall biosynthesis